MTASQPQGRIYRTADDFRAHVLTSAATVVRTANPGRDYSAPWFDAKVTEVAAAMIAKLIRVNTEAGRPDIARQVRLAWQAA